MVIKLNDVKIEHRYQEDIRRIIAVALKHNILLSPLEAELAWEEYSESMAAGWMNLRDDDYVWQCLPAWARGE